MAGFPGVLRARKQVLLYLGRFRHRPPRPGMPRLVGGPEERDLARIDARRPVRQHRPVEEARVGVMEGFIGQNKRRNAWTGTARFITPLPTLPLVRASHAVGVFHGPAV